MLHPQTPARTPLILGIIESKLDSSITNAEVNINDYSIIGNDRNRNGGGVACYIRNDLFFDTENSFHWTCFLLEILIPKVKPTAIGIFYRPSNVNDFLNTFSKNFQQIDTFSSNFQQMNNKTSEVYFLGHFDINLLQNWKIILKENQSNERKNSISALVNKYTDFCQTFSLTAKLLKSLLE